MPLMKTRVVLKAEQYTGTDKHTLSKLFCFSGYYDVVNN